MSPFIRCLVAVLSLVCFPAWAASVPGLYQVKEPVAAEQQAQDREQALQRALSTLVVRLTGDAQSANSAALAELRKNPQQIVSQYGYSGDALVVEFDPLSTDRQLRAAGLALWGANRPAVLTWWLNDTTEGSQLVGESQSAAAPLQVAAQYRGLPLRLPLADLSEQIVATEENLAARESLELKEASERYESDVVLTVRAKQSADSWQANWQFWLGEQHEQGVAKAASQAELADAVMLAVQQRLAPRFVIKAGGQETLTLVIDGVTMARFVQVERLLEPFAARLQHTEGSRLTYQVRASAEQLRGQLGLGHLREVTPPVEEAGQPAAAGDAQTLYFAW